MKKEYSIGIDISQETLDACVQSSEGVIFESRIDNSRKGLKCVFKELEKLGVNSKNCWVC